MPVGRLPRDYRTVAATREPKFASILKKKLAAHPVCAGAEAVGVDGISQTFVANLLTSRITLIGSWQRLVELYAPLLRNWLRR